MGDEVQMNLLQSIIQLLLANAQVRSLVGDKVFPHVAPAGTESPWIVVVRMGGHRLATHDRKREVVYNRISVISWSNSPDEAILAANTVVGALKYKQGTYSGVEIQGILLDNDFSMYDPNQLYGEVRDFQVMYKEVI